MLAERLFITARWKEVATGRTANMVSLSINRDGGWAMNDQRQLFDDTKRTRKIYDDSVDFC